MPLLCLLWAILSLWLVVTSLTSHAGGDNARVPEEAIWRQADPDLPLDSVPVALHFHQDLGESTTWRGWGLAVSVPARSRTSAHAGPPRGSAICFHELGSVSLLAP